MTKQELIEAIDHYWGEDPEDAEGYANIITKHTKPEKWNEIIECDLFFNRYNSVTSYDELAQEILQDECYEEDEEYLTQIEEALDSGNAQAFLMAQNWRIDEAEGGAIGFDDDVLLESEANNL